MATGAVELEISLFRSGGAGETASYGIELRFSDPASQADHRQPGAAPVRFDLAELRAHSLDPAGYGAYLLEQLLAEPAVRSGFDKAIAVAETANATLHIRLAISPSAAELHALRWETVRLPAAPAPLLTGQNVTFSRYLSGLDWRPVRLRPEAELRALVAVADPADVAKYRLAPVHRDVELGAARAGLGDIAVTELATRGQVTLDAIAAAMRDGYDILYLVAHGRLIDGEPYLFLENEEGAVARIPGRELTARIHDLADRPRLAVLVSCQSAGTGAAAPAEDAAPLAALGPRLAEAGVPAVIAMQGDVTMKTAAAFMSVFFRELRRDGLADRAMAVARGAVRDRPDWWMPVLFSRLKSGRIWGSVEDPLFGLPALPPLDLPDKPYRYLDWYRREDAWIFFGRGREIRLLYDRVTAADGPPIVLFYGQSGVGKSSLLAAGLRPRLEDSYEVRYARRDQSQGLLSTLAAALGTVAEADLAGAWCDLELQAGRSLLVILDQVEELFTRPYKGQPDEMAVFLTAVADIFGKSGQRPRGKLILGFRKEWLAEIKARLAERNLPRTEVFLERLDREGIIEVVTGPRATPRLRDHYRLTVADALPGLIADDLLADRESPVAPMLAILLTDMWESAKARSYDQPTLGADLYHDFRSRGLSLDDFLGRQLQTLGSRQPEVVTSGLALDLLAYHTTPLGTAEQHTMAELEQLYLHRLDVLPGLVQDCRDLYLLADPSKNQPYQPPASRLTHDTLAPHVRRRFDESDAPGQRARRILESRAHESRLNAKKPLLLAGFELSLVQQGASGMPDWLPEQRKLVALSDRRAARIKWLQRAALIVLFILAAIPVSQHVRESLLRRAAKRPQVLFPAVVVTLGDSSPGNNRIYPPQEVFVAAFAIDVYEVTYAQYRLCMEAKRCSHPREPAITEGFDDIETADGDLPVVWVDAYQAATFCNWLGRRLPREAEWERTARGTESRNYTWATAETPGPEHVNTTLPNYVGPGPTHTVPVDDRLFSAGSTPEGVMHLLGNVSEWTAASEDCNDDRYGCAMIWKGQKEVSTVYKRGGSWQSMLVTPTHYDSSDPLLVDNSTGFRCAQSTH